MRTSDREYIPGAIVGEDFSFFADAVNERGMVYDATAWRRVAVMVLSCAARVGAGQPREAERGRRRFRWEPMTFMMPIFASPIVFIPLLTLIDVSEGGMFAKAKLMVYFVAFQNGFFWKWFFEKQRHEHQRAAPDPARAS